MGKTITFNDIIDKWPSVPFLVADLRLSAPKKTMVNRIHKWRKRDYIPAEYWRRLLEASEWRGYDLTVDHLMDAAASRLAA